MENLKIKVNNDQESREAQELFFALGYGYEGSKIKTIQDFEYVGVYYFFAYSDGDLTTSYDEVLFNFKDSHKEITINQLRDMVVLKRNSVEDATHVGKSGSEYYLGDKAYFWNGMKWKQMDFYNLAHIKPIEREMREYLEKQEDGSYKLVMRGECNGKINIRVPNGAEIYTNCYDDDFFYKTNGEFLSVFDNEGWEETEYSSKNYKLEMQGYGRIVVWQREKESSCDMAKTIEEARQEYFKEVHVTCDRLEKHGHYFIDVSDVDEVDFYEIALRYGVTDPCAQHILKKCLALGNRGHKDFHEDVEDIYKTAKRMMKIHGLD